MIQPTAVQSDGLFRTDFMAAVTADAFVVINESALFNEANRFHRAAFNACATSDASVPNHFGSDGKCIFKHRLKNLLIPWHRA